MQNMDAHEDSDGRALRIMECPMVGYTDAKGLTMNTKNVLPRIILIATLPNKFIILNPSVGNRFYRLFKP